MKKKLIVFLFVAMACSKKESPPVYITQPQSASVLTPYSADFTVKVSGEGVRYQWQKFAGGQWIDIPGAISYVYKAPGIISNNAVQFRVIASNSAGSIPSEAATLVVTKLSDCLVATAAFSKRYLHTYSYDASNRLTKEDILEHSSGKIVSLNYTYNDWGKVAKITSPKWTDTFLYDNFGVPQSVTRTDLTGKVLYADIYGYATNYFQAQIPNAGVLPGNQGPVLVRYKFSGYNIQWFKGGSASDTTQYDFSRYMDYDSFVSPEYLIFVSTGGSLVPTYFENVNEQVTDNPFFYDPKPVNNYRSTLNQAGLQSLSLSFTYNASGAPTIRTKKQFGSAVGSDEVFTYINCKN